MNLIFTLGEEIPLQEPDIALEFGVCPNKINLFKKEIDLSNKHSVSKTHQELIFVDLFLKLGMKYSEKKKVLKQETEESIEAFLKPIFTLSPKGIKDCFFEFFFNIKNDRDSYNIKLIRKLLRHMDNYFYHEEIFFENFSPFTIMSSTRFEEMNYEKIDTSNIFLSYSPLISKKINFFLGFLGNFDSNIFKEGINGHSDLFIKLSDSINNFADLFFINFIFDIHKKLKISLFCSKKHLEIFVPFKLFLPIYFIGSTKDFLESKDSLKLFLCLQIKVSKNITIAFEYEHRNKFNGAIKLDFSSLNLYLIIEKTENGTVVFRVQIAPNKSINAKDIFFDDQLKSIDNNFQEDIIVEEKKGEKNNELTL